MSIVVASCITEFSYVIIINICLILLYFILFSFSFNCEWNAGLNLKTLHEHREQSTLANLHAQSRAGPSLCAHVPPVQDDGSHSPIYVPRGATAGHSLAFHQPHHPI